MERRVASLVSHTGVLLLFLQLTAEAWAQDGGTWAGKRDEPLDASACVSVWSKKPSVDPSKPGQVVRYGLTYQDFDRLINAVPVIKRALPIREVPKQIRHQAITLDSIVVGTTHEFTAFARLEMDRGRFLSADDNAKFENCAVLGAVAARVLFPEQNPIGQTVKCGADYFTVVGVALPSAGKNGGREEKRAVVASDVDVYIPLNTCKLRFGERVVSDRANKRAVEEYQLSAVVVQIDEGFKPEEAAVQIRAALKPFHPRDLLGVTVGGLNRERPVVERTAAEEKAK